MQKVLLLLLLAFFTANLSANDFSKLKGTWNYKVDYAPEGYEKGQMTFAEKDGQVTGEVKIQGQAIQLKDLVYADGQYKFNVTIEYNNIPVVLTVEGDKLTGKANTPEGVMPITGTREKPVKK